MDNLPNPKMVSPFETLPMENMYQIYCNLNPSDVLGTSLINKKCANIVKDDKFWKWYIKHKYYINTYPEELNPKDIAIESHKLLEQLFEKELYLPTYALEYVFKYIYPDTHLVVDIFSGQNMLPISNIICEMLDYQSDMYDEYISSLTQHLKLSISLPNITDSPELHTCPRPWEQTTKYTFNRDTQRFYSAVLKYVTTPTQYFVPLGIMTLNFNPDVYCIISHLRAVPRQCIFLYEYIQSLIDVIERAIFIQHLAPLKFT